MTLGEIFEAVLGWAGWTAVGAFSQAIEAVVVLVGGGVVFFQLRQWRAERMHKRWEALQFALPLFTKRDASDAADIVRSFPLDSLEEAGQYVFAPEIVKVEDALGMIARAIETGWLDKSDYLSLREGALSMLKDFIQPGVILYREVEESGDATVERRKEVIVRLTMLNSQTSSLVEEACRIVEQRLEKEEEEIKVEVFDDGQLQPREARKFERTWRRKARRRRRRADGDR